MLVYSELSGNSSVGPLSPLESAPCPASSSLLLHFSLSPIPVWFLEASHFLRFSEHFFTAPNLHFLPFLFAEYLLRPLGLSLDVTSSKKPSLVLKPGLCIGPSSSTEYAVVPSPSLLLSKGHSLPGDLTPGPRGFTSLWDPSHTTQQAGEGTEN